ncbi:hypothetical protein Q3G72_015084 [Acer saccharum]|nr:hypothetical protein Q3G72_015084 [Acer saccharum]
MKDSIPYSKLQKHMYDRCWPLFHILKLGNSRGQRRRGRGNSRGLRGKGSSRAAEEEEATSSGGGGGGGGGGAAYGQAGDGDAIYDDFEDFLDL